MVKDTLQFYTKLSQLRSQIGAIEKNATNDYTHSSYFDINTLLEQLDPLLLEHKLHLSQPIIDGCVYTIIEDLESEHNVVSFLEIPSGQNPQQVGSTITYYRRYTLTSLLALRAEDNDGNQIKPSAKEQQESAKWLNPGTKDWKNAIDKKVPLAEVKKHYKISAKNEAKYLEQLS